MSVPDDRDSLLRCLGLIGFGIIIQLIAISQAIAMIVVSSIVIAAVVITSPAWISLAIISRLVRASRGAIRKWKGRPS